MWEDENLGCPDSLRIWSSSQWIIVLESYGFVACALIRQDKERQIKAVLVATKTDLPTQRHAVSLQAAQDWATANGMDFCSTSSVRF